MPLALSRYREVRASAPSGNSSSFSNGSSAAKRRKIHSLGRQPYGSRRSRNLSPLQGLFFVFDPGPWG